MSSHGCPPTGKDGGRRRDDGAMSPPSEGFILSGHLILLVLAVLRQLHQLLSRCNNCQLRPTCVGRGRRTGGAGRGRPRPEGEQMISTPAPPRRRRRRGHLIGAGRAIFVSVSLACAPAAWWRPSTGCCRRTGCSRRPASACAIGATWVLAVAAPLLVVCAGLSGCWLAAILHSRGPHGPPGARRAGGALLGDATTRTREPW